MCFCLQPTRGGLESHVAQVGTTSSSLTFTAPAVGVSKLDEDAGYVVRFEIGDRFFIDKNAYEASNNTNITILEFLFDFFSFLSSSCLVMAFKTVATSILV